jgi:uncharacterized protein RhaS with RHS repeats
MLSADPIVQEPHNLQNLNRYSYVLNNPLSYTDPTGLSFLQKYWHSIVQIAATIITGGTRGATASRAIGLNAKGLAASTRAKLSAVGAGQWRGGKLGCF